MLPPVECDRHQTALGAVHQPVIKGNEGRAGATKGRMGEVGPSIRPGGTGGMLAMGKGLG